MQTARERPYHHGKLREALLAAAEDKLEAAGPEAISLRELGRSLAVSHTAAKRHFADKRALLDTLAERGFRRLGAMLAEAVVDAESGFDERLKRLARAHLRFGLDNPALLRWMFDASARADAPPELVGASDHALAHASIVFRDGQVRGEVVKGDPEELGLAGFAAVQGLISVAASGRFRHPSPEVAVDSVVDRLIVGLRPRG